MKANAPEKIQVHLIKNNYGDWSIEGYSFLEDKQIGMTEYTRTNAFIEKACAWLKSYRQDTPDGTGYIAGIVNDKTIEDFRKYMKGE
jgi:hypothetical protein